MKNNNSSKEKLDLAIKKLEEGVKDVFSSGRYKEYLQTMSKFHNYSFSNVMMILMQKPDASLVAGFNKWKQAFGRTVNKGEKGIHILAPATYKKKVQELKLDENGSKILDNNGDPIVEDIEVTVPYFRIVYVFDISQTDGKELPTIVQRLEGARDDYDSIMDAIKKVSHVPIVFEDIKDANGYFSYLEQKIAIKNGLSQVHTIKTAIHELAHSRLHTADDNKSRSTKEVEAESVAFVVLNHFGIDTSDYSFGYLAGWSSNKELNELKISLANIQKESAEIINKLEKELGILEELQPNNRKQDIINLQEDSLEI